VVLVEAFAVVSLPAQTITAFPPFDENRVVVARQVRGANFGQICQHFAATSPDELEIDRAKCAQSRTSRRTCVSFLPTTQVQVINQYFGSRAPAFAEADSWQLK